MEEVNSFKTIEGVGSADLREKASKFLAFAHPISSEKEAEDIANEYRKKHPKANHVCYAYKYEDKYRLNDDGEPSGTAARPIYGQILSMELNEVGVYVVRYFGGTKLGASGLIAAYKESAKMALQAAVIIQKELMQEIDLKFSYENMGEIMNAVKELDLKILHKDFNVDALIRVACPIKDLSLMIRKLKAKLLNFNLESITDDTELEICEIVLKDIIKVKKIND